MEVYFDGLYRAHDKTEYPKLGYNYVSGVWQARHGRGAHTLLGERAFSEPSCTVCDPGGRAEARLDPGGYMAFHYQWLKGQANHPSRPPT